MKVGEILVVDFVLLIVDVEIDAEVAVDTPDVVIEVDVVNAVVDVDVSFSFISQPEHPIFKSQSQNGSSMKQTLENACSPFSLSTFLSSRMFLNFKSA